MTAQNKRSHRALGFLGGLAFTTLALEWLLLLFAVLVRFMNSGLGSIVFPKHEVQPTARPIVTTGSGPDFVTAFLATAIGLGVLAFAVYLLTVRYPRAAREAGTKVVRETAKKAIPVIARKPIAKLPIKRRRLLTKRVTYWVKIVLSFVPVLLLPIALHDEYRGIAEQFAIVAQAILGLVVIVLFSAQTWLSSVWHVRQEEVN